MNSRYNCVSAYNQFLKFINQHYYSEDKAMKATSNLVRSIPGEATVFFSDRIEPENSWTSSFAFQVKNPAPDFATHVFFDDRIEPEKIQTSNFATRGPDFAAQFVGGVYSETVDDGTFDSIDFVPSYEKIMSIVIEEGSVPGDTCAARRLEVMWTVK